MKKSILACLAALALLSAAVMPSAALGQSARDARRKEEVITHLKKARSENRRVLIRFKNGVDVTGRVGELRERGFTFEPDNEEDANDLKGMGVTAAVLYENIQGVEHPSKVRKFFKGVRYGLLGAGGTVIFLPYVAVMALLGREVCC
jgi:uncharacterized membrane protein YfcA